MTSRWRSLRLSLGSSEEGSTIVEFALIMVPLFVLLIGGMDLAYTSYVRTVMQGALNDAARKASVETPQFSAQGQTLAKQVENTIRKIVGKIAANAQINVTQRSFFDFSRIGNPERLMTDNNGNGRFDAAGRDCWEDANFNGTFDMNAGASGRGGASDVVFYKADITMPRLFPAHAFLPVSPTMSLSLETAVRNQPFGEQPTPPTLCAGP